MDNDEIMDAVSRLIDEFRYRKVLFTAQPEGRLWAIAATKTEDILAWLLYTNGEFK